MTGNRVRIRGPYRGKQHYGRFHINIMKAQSLNDGIVKGGNKADMAVPAADYHAENSCMEAAIQEAREGIYHNHGGPFGAVVVKDGKIIGRGHNMVVLKNDSTAHGEISAIRDAEARIGSYDLTGSVLYTTGEPCAMCLAASIWANITKIYYGGRIADNAGIGFRDQAMEALFEGRKALDQYLVEMDREACLQLFEEYRGLDRERY